MSHNGSVVDPRTRTIVDRDGLEHALDDLVIGERTLYYRRRVTFGTRAFDMYKWLFAERGWALSRFEFLDGSAWDADWYLEPDPIAVTGDRWHVADGIIDLLVFEGSRYEVLDLDEFAAALADGSLDGQWAAQVLTSFHAATLALREVGWSGRALLERHAPELAARGFV